MVDLMRISETPGLDQVLAPFHIGRDDISDCLGIRPLSWNMVLLSVEALKEYGDCPATLTGSKTVLLSPRTLDDARETGTSASDKSWFCEVSQSSLLSIISR